MKTRIITTAALVCCFVVCFAATLADISGSWKGSIKDPNGNDIELNYVFKIDGDKLSGTAQAHGEPKAITDCKITGTDISFNVPDDDGSAIPHKGKYYAAGDSISMDISFQQMNFHTTLKRADK